MQCDRKIAINYGCGCDFESINTTNQRRTELNEKIANLHCCIAIAMMHSSRKKGEIYLFRMKCKMRFMHFDNLPDFIDPKKRKNGKPKFIEQNEFGL